MKPGDRLYTEMQELREQLEAERGLADVFRRVLAQSHSLSGMSLMISGQTVEITEQEFDLVWNALDEIDGEDYTVRLSNPASTLTEAARGSGLTSGNTSEAHDDAFFPASVPDEGVATPHAPVAPGDASGRPRVSGSPGVGADPAMRPEARPSSEGGGEHRPRRSTPSVEPESA